MQQEYSIFMEGDGPVRIVFDDQRTVGELVAALFVQTSYHEPFGMDIVTLFQSHSAKTTTGWFITDRSMRCADAIDRPDALCLAYHMPGVFYFAEGGWGHHMDELGNHPALEDPVKLKLRLEDFRNTVVIAGRYTFSDVVRALKRTGYIPQSADRLEVRTFHDPRDTGGDFDIPFSDQRMDLPLCRLVPLLPLELAYIAIC